MRRIILIFIIFLNYKLNATEIFNLDAYSARSFALAEIGSTLENDISSFNLNPAILGTLEYNSFDFSYMFWIEDINIINFETGIPFKSIGNFASGFTYIGFPDFQNYDETGKQLSSLSCNDLLINFGFGNKIMNFLYYGFSLNYIKISLGEYSSKVFALNSGILYRTKISGITKSIDKNFNIGFSIFKGLNSLKFIEEEITAFWRIKAGIKYDFLNIENLKTSFLSEWRINSYTEPKFSTGIEICLFDYYNLRIGYIFKKDFLHKLNYGVGIIEKRVGYNLIFDYSYIPFKNFGISHIISLKIEFDKSLKKSIEKEKK